MRCAVCGSFIDAYIHVAVDPAYEHDADPAIPASKVRDLARAWTTRIKSEDAYREGYDDARNACADALDLLVHESEGGAK